MSEGGFLLRSWSSNERGLNEIFSQDGRGIEDNASLKILGYDYSTEKDEYSVAGGNINKCNSVTKRLILAKIAGYFDPLGLTLPLIVKGKILLQSLLNNMCF